MKNPNLLRLALRAYNGEDLDARGFAEAVLISGWSDRRVAALLKTGNPRAHLERGEVRIYHHDRAWAAYGHAEGISEQDIKRWVEACVAVMLFRHFHTSERLLSWDLWSRTYIGTLGSTLTSSAAILKALYPDRAIAEKMYASRSMYTDRVLGTRARKFLAGAPAVRKSKY